MTSLEKLNQFTRRELSEEEVYLFDVILCDNDVDRDLERFSEKALEQMQKLFIGKTGIFDHNPKSDNQTARIYDTELVTSPDKLTKDGRTLVSLKAHAYMIRTDSNADFIREIDGGIKKEVSVSCLAKSRICSVCGCRHEESICSHIAGQTYGKQFCCTVLDDIQDAYEWSFVAVPAQPAAGVTKHFAPACDTTEKQEHSDMSDMKNVLEEIQAQMKSEVFQLCRKSQSTAICDALSMAAEKMTLQELFAFKQSLLDEQRQSLAQADVQLADFRQR